MLQTAASLNIKAARISCRWNDDRSPGATLNAVQWHTACRRQDVDSDHYGPNNHFRHVSETSHHAAVVV